MAKRYVSVLALLILSASLAGGSVAARPAAEPPPGLTSYGRTVWNLDALLHDTFGAHVVILNRRTPRSANFSTVFINNAYSGYYLYTFSDATGSAFSTATPRRPPKVNIGASGGEIPLRVRGSYISCGGGRWLFMHYGNGAANWQISCHK